MKLKETFINLVGFFKSSIDDRIFLSAGDMNAITNSKNELIADVFTIHFFDVETNRITDSRRIVFNQREDKIVLIYSGDEQDTYEVTNFSDNSISLVKDGIKYSFDRIVVRP